LTRGEEEFLRGMEERMASLSRDLCESPVGSYEAYVAQVAKYEEARRIYQEAKAIFAGNEGD
jgi:hypothetical protein